MLWIFVGLLFYKFLPQSVSGQLSLLETLNTKSVCGSNQFSLDCGDKLIAIELVQFAYRPGCESTCCTFEDTDCFVNASKLDTGYIRRECSGHKLCTLNLPGYQDFCSYGTLEPSYILVQYYCIPETRVTSICSSTTLSSNGPPLYLINENYPSVTTGDSTCSCSVEVYDCSSDINVYTIDVDLYYDTSYCNQHLRFVDGTNTTLKAINCEDYYGSSFVADTLSSHYTKVDFLDNEVEEQEGYFFLGFAASETDITFSLSCTSESESWCVGCDAPPSIPNGYLELNEEGNTSFQASAATFCDSGFEIETPQETCLANASWENAVCAAKDCGSAPSITFGNAALDDPENSTYGAVITVTCYPGYETNKTNIMCLASGLWDYTVCFPKDCGSSITIEFGSASLDDDNNSTYAATATVTCIRGFKASKENISCLQTGSWDTVNCSPIDCGSSITIEFGTASLDDDNNSTYGATATVSCIKGYEFSKENISCLQTGNWDTVDCSPIDNVMFAVTCCIEDCGPVISIQHGHVNLRDDGNTSYGATADIVCDSGYESTTDVIVCSFTGVWVNVSACVLKERSDDGQTGASKETKDSLSPGVIAAIVVVCILVLIAGIIVPVSLVYRSRAVAPNIYTKEDPVEKIQSGKSQTALQTDNENIKPVPAPEVPKKHEISHGPVYIDHGEAHIFGITIHLPHPFGHSSD